MAQILTQSNLQLVQSVSNASHVVLLSLMIVEMEEQTPHSMSIYDEHARYKRITTKETPLHIAVNRQYPIIHEGLESLIAEDFPTWSRSSFRTK